MITGTLSERERHQRAAFVAGLCTDRAVLLLGSAPTTVPEPLARAAASVTAVDLSALGARPAEADTGAVVVVLDDLHPDDVDVLRRAVDERVAAGAPAIVAAREAAADRLGRAWPTARRAHQGLVEASVLREASEDAATLPIPLPALDATARWTIFLQGNELPAVAATGPIVTSGASARQQAALQRANQELRAANARVRANGSSKQGAAAASLQSRLAAKDREIARIEALLEETLAAAKQNDDLFQGAREQLNARVAELRRPEHRVATSLRFRLARIPGAKLAGRLLRALRRRG